MNKKLFNLFVVMSAILFACENEPCNDFVCLNGIPLPDKRDCVCLCDYGWRGDDCSIEDKCKTNNVVCLPGKGICDENTGLCQCLSGFEGDSCQIYSRDRFLDSGDSTTWRARDTCLPGAVNGIPPYTIIIKESSRDDITLALYNLLDLDSNAGLEVRVDGYEFDQRFSNISLADSVLINDLKGVLSQDEQVIRVTYSTDEASSNCSGTWIRN